VLQTEEGQSEEESWEAREEGQREESRQMTIARKTAGWGIAAMLAALLAASGSAHAAALSNTLFFDFQVGAGVLSGNPSNVETCTSSTESECKPGQRSPLPGAFAFPQSVALAANGDVYVAEEANNRIQELEPDGKFLRMFGWNVNKTKAREGAPQAERNMCTAVEVAKGAECGAGEAGTGEPEQLFAPQDVAIDPATGDVFAYEIEYSRIEEFSETGEFELMIGRKVNTDEQEPNICTRAERANCQEGSRSDEGSHEHGAFKVGQEYGNLLTVCGGKLYVADESRVQEFSTSSGSFAGEVELGVANGFPANGVATSIATDDSCDLYVTEARGRAGNNKNAPSGVYEFSPGGGLLNTFDTSSTEIEAIALDAFGRMALIEGPHEAPHGVLLDLATGKTLSEFRPPGGMGFGMADLAFNPAGELYAADAAHQDVELYHPVPVAEVVTEQSPPCTTRPSGRGSTSLTLEGSINPEGIPNTQGWFAYGATPALGSITPLQSFPEVEATFPLVATVTGLTPNTVYFYRAEARDAKAPSVGEILSCKTRAVAPVIRCCPQVHASTSTFASIVLEDEINPEKANAEYWFEYVEASRCGAGIEVGECPGVTRSAVQHSAENGFVLARQTINELQPSTTYRFRLTGTNEFEYAGEKEGGAAEYDEPTAEEGTFTTGEAPVPTVATLAAGNVGPTSATLSGSVNPNGSPTSYTFELGVDRGSATEYGTVLSASAGKGRAPMEVAFTVTSLQPGTAYRYRITARDGYASESGESVAFTTTSPGSGPPPPGEEKLLPVPPIPFPKAPSKGGKGEPTRAERLSNALKICRSKPKKHRAACERKARKQYGGGRKKQSKKAARHRKRR
jgi:NHL repeat-containing protein